MAAALQRHKDYELKANEQLYDNLKLLNTKHPGRKELEDVLKKDMFIKTNKNAFNEVVYYLYSLEYMKKIEKFRNWPPYDSRTELGLRQEIIRHVTQLNTFYKHSDIPILMQSQLGTPSGMKITKFFLKWSELCLFEYLSHVDCISSRLLYCIKPNKNPKRTEIMFKAFQNQIDEINHDVHTLMKSYDQLLNYKKNEIENIQIKQDKYNVNIAQIKVCLQKEQRNFEEKYALYPREDQLKFQIKELEDYSKKYQVVSDTLDEIEEIRKKLVAEDRYLVHNKDDFIVPSDLKKHLKNTDLLNLKDYTEAVEYFLQLRSKDLPNPSWDYLEKINKDVEEVTKKYDDLNKKLQSQLSTLQSEVSKIQEKFPVDGPVPPITCFDEILAVPLAD